MKQFNFRKVILKNKNKTKNKTKVISNSKNLRTSFFYTGINKLSKINILQKQKIKLLKTKVKNSLKKQHLSKSFYNKNILRTFKFSYDFFYNLKNLINITKKLFKPYTFIGKINVKSFFEVKLNFNILKNFNIPRKYVRKLIKKYIKFYIKNSRKIFYKSTMHLNYLNNLNIKKHYITRSINIMLNKILNKNRQRLFFLLNYGFFFTFLLKSNSLLDLNAIFKNKLIFNKNKGFIKLFLLKLFRNYLLRNNFIGSNNRYYFLLREISLNFSETFSLNLFNISNLTKKSLIKSTLN